MRSDGRARDHELLDDLEKFERVSIGDTVWRVVLGGRDPLLCHASGGRWDPGKFDVLYTSFEPDGAIAEMYFHLSRQPVFPSKVEFVLAEIEVKTQCTIVFPSLTELRGLGVDTASYSDLSYRRMQEIVLAALPQWIS